MLQKRWGDGGGVGNDILISSLSSTPSTPLHLGSCHFSGFRVRLSCCRSTEFPVKPANTPLGSARRNIAGQETHSACDWNMTASLDKHQVVLCKQIANAAMNRHTYTLETKSNVQFTRVAYTCWFRLMQCAAKHWELIPIWDYAGRCFKTRRCETMNK